MLNVVVETTMTIYHQAILEFFQNYKAYEFLGKALAKEGDLNSAIACWYQSIKLEPNDPWLYYHLGEAFSKQANFSTAAKNFQRAIELDKNIHWFYLQLGKVLSQQQSYTQAIACFQKVIELDPQYPWVYHSLAEALTEQNNLADAIKIYRQGIEVDESISLFYERIYFLEQAIAQKDTADNSGSPNSLRNHTDSQVNSNILSLQTEAIILLQQQNLASVLECYRKIIQIAHYSKIHLHGYDAGVGHKIAM